MLRTRLALAAVLATALVVVASATAATPTLNGVDGPGFNISLKKAGVKVKTLKAIAKAIGCKMDDFADDGVKSPKPSRRK